MRVNGKVLAKKNFEISKAHLEANIVRINDRDICYLLLFFGHSEVSIMLSNCAPRFHSNRHYL